MVVFVLFFGSSYDVHYCIFSPGCHGPTAAAALMQEILLAKSPLVSDGVTTSHFAVHTVDKVCTGAPRRTCLRMLSSWLQL